MDGARGILSCASCRRRKLKCDREEPCGNCVARQFECAYASNVRGRGRTPQRRDDKSQLNDRIRRLEHLMEAITAGRSQAPEAPGTARERQGAPDLVPPPGKQPSASHIHVDARAAEGLEIKPGQILSQNAQTTYVSGTHWEAICNEVAEIREHLDRNTPNDGDDDQDVEHPQGPMLLEGPWVTSDMQTILADVPPRHITDKLVSRYFDSTAILVSFLHPPTFQEEYHRFWLHPNEASMPWISLLFGILGVGIFLYSRSEDEPPSELGDVNKAKETFQRRSTECLIISKYFTAPGDYTMEALVTNLQNEALWRPDAHLGVWAMAGVAIRVAFRMGYHRDPAGYPQLSVFLGEMRRRVWSCINQLDALTSYQLGLPPMIDEGHCDTRLPSNLLDEDFGPTSTSLPPSRPLTELTPILYVITKAGLSSIFRTIFTQVSLGRTDAYAEIMALDQRLCTAHDSISPRFRLSSLAESVTVPPCLLVRRYRIELLFLKSRCILHRHHMPKAYHNPEYGFSRAACLDAAMRILSHQFEIVQELKPTGRFRRHRLLLTSIEQIDFLLALMIVCLEVSSRDRESFNDEGTLEMNPHGLKIFTTRDLIEALGCAHQHLRELKLNSTECQRAYNVLSVMMAKFSGNFRLHQGAVGVVSVEDPADTPDKNPSDTCRFQFGSGPSIASNSEQDVPQMSNLADFGSFFDNPALTNNWDTWESFVGTSGFGPNQPFPDT